MDTKPSVSMSPPTSAGSSEQTSGQYEKDLSVTRQVPLSAALMNMKY